MTPERLQGLQGLKGVATELEKLTEEAREAMARYIWDFVSTLDETDYVSVGDCVSCLENLAEDIAEAVGDPEELPIRKAVKKKQTVLVEKSHVRRKRIR
jgi:hypothetical protein